MTTTVKQKRWQVGLWAIFLVVVGFAGSAMATSLVVVSAKKVVGYRAGDVIDTATVISLSAQAELTLLTVKGEKISVAGPLNGSLNDRLREKMPELLAALPEQDHGLLASLSGILKKHRRSNMRLRGGGKKPEPKDPWQISMFEGGDQCVAQDERPELWRPHANDPEQVVIKAENLKDQTLVEFASGNETHPWPIDLSLVDKETYLVTDGGQQKERSLVLHVIPSDLPTRAHVAAALSDNNCSRQAAQLLIHAEIDKFIGKLITDDQF
ncbi:MAG: hypothetical protein OEL66_06540 [Desulfobulbaceae bacterium]|nr:hypothetical protein [Desulfobulbaceae bacterium]